MAVGPQYEHQYCIVKNAVNQPVLLGDSPAPSTFGLSFQGFGVTSACLGMFHQFNKHLCHFLESLWLIVLQLLHMQLCLVSVIKSIHDGQRLLRKKTHGVRNDVQLFLDLFGQIKYIFYLCSS